MFWPLLLRALKEQTQLSWYTQCWALLGRLADVTVGGCKEVEKALSCMCKMQFLKENPNWGCHALDHNTGDTGRCRKQLQLSHTPFHNPLLPPVHKGRAEMLPYPSVPRCDINCAPWCWDGLCWGQDGLSKESCPRSWAGWKWHSFVSVCALLGEAVEHAGSVPGHGAAAALLWWCTAVETAQLGSLALPQRGIFLEMQFKVLILMGVTDTQIVCKQDKLLRHALGTAFGWCLQLPISDYFWLSSSAVSWWKFNNHNLMHALLFSLLLHPESPIKAVMFIIWGSLSFSIGKQKDSNEFFTRLHLPTQLSFKADCLRKGKKWSTGNFQMDR